MTKPSPIIGCVSFLNALPLIDGFAERENLPVRFDVPSALLADLEARQVDLALCPVIDFQDSPQPLVVVPVGGIGCDGPTLTVRLYSRKPLNLTQTVHVDTHSHTSIILLQVLLHTAWGLRPRIEPYHARPGAARPDTMLLIGDKVVTDAPPSNEFPFQMDLGQEWKYQTGLPFVFAVWMARQGEDVTQPAAALDRTRLFNARCIDAIARRNAQPHGWPADLAVEYLGNLLKYEIGPAQLTAIQLFWRKAADLNLTPHRRPLQLAPAAAACIGS